MATNFKDNVTLAKLSHVRWL